MVTDDLAVLAVAFVVFIVFSCCVSLVKRKKEREEFPEDGEEPWKLDTGDLKKDTKEKPVLKINMGGSTKVISETDGAGGLKHVENSGKWKCVVCETMNDGSICIVCGNEKSA